MVGSGNRERVDIGVFQHLAVINVNPERMRDFFSYSSFVWESSHLQSSHDFGLQKISFFLWILTIMTFEFDGEKYSQASKHQKEWGNRIISELPLRGDETVLDLGCGDGVLTAQLALMVPNGRVIGIDASKGMIETAEKQRKPNLVFRLMDINHLDLPEKFDLIFSNATLHWVKDHNRLLSRVWEILKEKGRIRFNFAGEGNCATFIRIVEEVMKEKKFAVRFERFEWPWFMPSREEYAGLLSRFTFREIRIWEEEADRYFADAEEMIRWIDQPNLVPFLPLLQEENRLEFRSRIVERMLQETLQEDGRCFEVFRRINVFALK
jgi:trans-aconitate methyltransferase